MGDVNLKWYGTDDYLIVTVESLKCQSSCHRTKYIRYYLYVGKNIQSINKRIRCGIQDSGSAVQVYEAIQSNLTGNNSITFKIQLDQIPSDFALSARA